MAKSLKYNVLLGLKKFCQLSRQDKSQSRMLSYLKTYPDCQDLFDLLETEDRPGTEEVEDIFYIFTIPVIQGAFHVKLMLEIDLVTFAFMPR